MKQFIAFLLLFTVATTGFAKIPKPMKNTYVNDFAGVLKPGDIRTLNAKIHRMERLSTVQMAIVLVNKLPADYDIEEYTLLIARKWHVGKHNKGLVYVAAIQQHKQRLEVARLLTTKMTDAKCAEVLDAIKPFFRQQDYNSGLNAMVDEVTSVVVPPAVPRKTQSSAAVQKSEAQAQSGDKMSDTTATVILVVIIISAVLLIVWLFRRSSQRKQAVYQQSQGYNNYNGGYTGYNGPANGGYYNGPQSSGIGSALGGFAAGYAARTIQDNLSEHHHHSGGDYGDYNRQNAYDDNTSYSDNSSGNQDRDITVDDQNSSDWGNWGSGSDSSDSDSGSSYNSDDSSSNNGYDGDSGATSDW